MDGWEWKWLQRNATKLKNLEYTIWGTKVVTQTLNKPCLHDIVFPNEKMTHGMEKPEGWQNQLDGKTSKTIPRDEHVSGMRRPARWQYPRGLKHPQNEKTAGWEDPRDEITREMRRLTTWGGPENENEKNKNCLLYAWSTTALALRFLLDDPTRTFSKPR